MKATNKHLIIGMLSLLVSAAPLAPGMAADSEKKDAAAAGDTTAKAPAPAAEEIKRPYNEEAIKHYNKGHDYHQQANFNQAISEYRAAITADDRMEEAYTNLGLIYAAQRNYTKAIDAFRKSLALNSKRPNALNGLGTVLYAKNKLGEAMEKWKAAIEIDPNFASAYYNMGNALENEKDYRNAVDAYVHALNINPSMADAYYRVGSIYAKQKHPAQANLLLSKAVDLEPTAEFVHEAKRTIASLEGDFAPDEEEPQVKMNIVAPADPNAAPPSDSKNGD